MRPLHSEKHVDLVERADSLTPHPVAEHPVDDKKFSDSLVGLYLADHSHSTKISIRDHPVD